MSPSHIKSSSDFLWSPLYQKHCLSASPSSLCIPHLLPQPLIATVTLSLFPTCFLCFLLKEVIPRGSSPFERELSSGICMVTYRVKWLAEMGFGISRDSHSFLIALPCYCRVPWAYAILKHSCCDDLQKTLTHSHDRSSESKLGVVDHVVPIRQLKQKDCHVLEANLGYRVKPSSKIEKTEKRRKRLLKPQKK